MINYSQLFYSFCSFNYFFVLSLLLSLLYIVLLELKVWRKAANVDYGRDISVFITYLIYFFCGFSLMFKNENYPCFKYLLFLKGILELRLLFNRLFSY